MVETSKGPSNTMSSTTSSTAAKADKKAASSYGKASRHHPVVLVEGKVRKKCEAVERDTISLKEKLIVVRRGFEAARSEHQGEIERLDRQSTEIARQTETCVEETRLATATRDEQTQAMSSLLSDFRRLEARRSALSQQVATTEASILTLKGQIEEANAALRDLDENCAQEQESGAANDYHAVTSVDSVQEYRREAELGFSRSTAQIAVERQQLEDAITAARGKLKNLSNLVYTERGELEAKRGRYDRTIREALAEHAHRMEAHSHEKTVLNAKLLQIQGLNEKLEARLAQGLY
ncbi:unnamed protein product [Amoebophrya sp. A25]|nr:unnamed protein product [Amoebophrya sp. A25]|eukprot:GSA25T00000146001.1